MGGPGRFHVPAESRTYEINRVSDDEASENGITAPKSGWRK